MLNIQNREDIFDRLSRLEINQLPVFGMMRPQHMVEHLIWSIQFSNSTIRYECATPEDEILATKDKFLYADEYPRGIKSPLLKADELMPLLLPDMTTAIAVLNDELNNFDSYFAVKDYIQPVHRRMGPLNHEDWILFHNKHFTHHFTQFELV